MEWSIQEVSRLTGVTSRTLRHYHAIELVTPSRVGDDGRRFYDARCLLMLQRVMLLKELGLNLAKIREVLSRSTDEVQALQTHLKWIETEKERLTALQASVQSTIRALQEKEMMMPEDMFDGFNHADYYDEVSKRWGAATAEQSDTWWKNMNATDRSDFQAEIKVLINQWKALAGAGVEPSSKEAQELAARHVQWLRTVPGIPDDMRSYVEGLAQLYADDPRFAAQYQLSEDDTRGAEFVKEALLIFAQKNL